MDDNTDSCLLTKPDMKFPKDKDSEAYLIRKLVLYEFETKSLMASFLFLAFKFKKATIFYKKHSATQ